MQPERTTTRFQKTSWLLGSLLFWATVYFAGKHPDATWGDGLGYALAIANGFDWGVNANSHFLYLNFHRLWMLVPGVSNSLTVLGYASVAWAILALLLNFILFSRLYNFHTAICALHILASCFSFWRHACIAEVYTTSLCFWLGCFIGLASWLKNKSEAGRLICLWTFSIGLLVHIQLILLVPAILLAFIRTKSFRFRWLWPLAVPASVVVFSVYFLKINTLHQVFFDNAGDKMLDFQWKTLLTGPAFSVAALLYMLPATCLLFFLLKGWKSMSLRLLKKAEIQVFAVAFLTITGFCSLYPEPGIHVFLLPAVVLLSGFLADAIYRQVQAKQWKVLLLVPVLQVVVFTGLHIAAMAFAPSPPQYIAIKGGYDYYIFPWAAGNATSVLEVAASQSPLDSTLNQWNLEQARKWNELQNRSEN